MVRDTPPDFRRLATLALLVTLSTLSSSRHADAQLGPAPGLAPSSLGQPNGPAALDANGRASNLSVLPQNGVAARSLAARLSDRLSLLDFGARCDGTTDDSAAILAAEASGRWISIPASRICRAATISQAAISAVFTGPGQIMTSDGNLRGPVVTQMTSPPSHSAGFSGGVLSGFNGDLSHVPIAIEHRVSGAATLGQPAAGTYLITPEASADLINSYNTSGYNSALSGLAGRTGLAVRLTTLGQYGQGDMAANWFTCFAASTLPNSTSFLENPECSGLTGQLIAGAAGVYLQGIGDINLSDGGFDVSGIGETYILHRTVPSSAMGTTWIGSYQYSTGTVPADAAFSSAGPFNIVLDAVDAASGAAVAAGAGQRLYLNSTQPNGTHFPSTVALGTEYVDYTATNGLELVVGGKPVVQATPNGAVVTGHLETNGPLPTLSACGTSTFSYGSNDNAGVINFSGSPTSCQMNFTQSFAPSPIGFPVCVFMANGNNATYLEEGATAVKIIFARTDFAAMTNAMNYICR